MIIRNKQERSVQETDYQPDVREFDQRLASHEVAADQLGAGRMDQLSQLEASSIDILAMLREQRDEENERLVVQERTFVDDVPSSAETVVRMPKLRRGLSPWWLVAAVTVGFVVGFAMPRSTRSASSASRYTLTADSLHGRSLAGGDVNMALLVTF